MKFLVAPQDEIKNKFPVPLPNSLLFAFFTQLFSYEYFTQHFYYQIIVCRAHMCTLEGNEKNGKKNLAAV